MLNTGLVPKNYSREYALPAHIDFIIHQRNYSYLVNAMVRFQKPGEKPNNPGEYVERGQWVWEIPNPRQVTIEPGDNKLPLLKKKA